MTREEMLQKYEDLTAADSYILGFEFRGDLYIYHMNELAEIADRVILDRMSSKRGGAAKIRIRLDKWSKARLACKATNCGKMSVMEYAGKYNMGEKFERYIHELNGKTWVKDKTPFWVAGDIEIAGKQVQIKFDGAEITNENTLAKALT